MPSYSKQVSSFYKAVSVTPTIDTSAYSDGDHLGTLHTITIGSGWVGLATLVSVTVLDKAKQSSAMDIIFFNASPTIASSDNAALDFTDAEAEKIIGHVSIAASDYVTLNSNTVACTGLASAISLKSATEGVLYAILKSSGTPTYVGTTDLIVTYTFGLDF